MKGVVPMSIFEKRLDDINIEDLELLIENSVQESKRLDYKQELPSFLNTSDRKNDKEKSKKEFLKDISAFANTIGGIIIYGIEEKRDEDNKPTGLPERLVGLGEINIDKVKQGMENVIRDGLDPKLHGYEIRGIKINDIEGKENVILLVKIPRSLMAPHMVLLGWNRFFTRKNTGNDPMNTTLEIKQAFLQTDAWQKEAEELRLKRITEVRNQMFLPKLKLSNSCYYLLHILPLGTNRTHVDLRKHQDTLINMLHIGGGFNYRFNLEGYLVYDQDNLCEKYVQFFRNGGMEIFDTIYQCHDGSNIYFDGNQVESNIKDYVTRYFGQVSPALEVEPPFVIYLTLCGIKSLQIRSVDRFTSKLHHQFDRDLILFPGIEIQDVSDIDDALQQLFDILWQAGGRDGSPRTKK